MNANTIIIVANRTLINCNLHVVYSRNILRAPIFEDFEDFLLTSKILSSKFLAASYIARLSIIVAQLICKPQKFYHENFHLMQNLLNLENFNPQNFLAIRYIYIYIV